MILPLPKLYYTYLENTTLSLVVVFIFSGYEQYPLHMHCFSFYDCFQFSICEWFIIWQLFFFFILFLVFPVYVGMILVQFCLMGLYNFFYILLSLLCASTILFWSCTFAFFLKLHPICSSYAPSMMMFGGDFPFIFYDNGKVITSLEFIFFALFVRSIDNLDSLYALQ